MNPSEEPRKRTARACDSCYKRKPPKASRLAERISRIEQLLAENLMRDPTSEGAMEVPPLSDLATNASNSPTSSNTSISQPIISSTVGVHFAGRELGVMSLMTGIPFLLPEGQQWIQARTGQTISSDKLSPARAPWEKERGQISNSILMDLRSQDLFSLPDQRSVMLYFNAYRNSPVMRRVFPLVDADLFAETIQEVYQQPQSSFQFGQASSRACVIAFLAFVARLPPVKNKTLDSPFSYVDHESLAVKSQFLLSQVMQEPASLEGAQAVSLMTLYEISSGNMRACNYFGALAARLVFMLGGNLLHSRTYLPSDRGKKKRQQLRNLFWVCYTMDKDIALRTGQPPTIADENCDLTLPAGYLEAAYDTPEDERISFSQPVFPFDLRLSIIKSRTHSALYSISALQKSDADLLKSIRELDDELEAWRLSVPSPYRPTMSFTPEAVDPNVSMHSVMLRLNYYLCMSLIHSASSRCKAWGQGNHGMMDGVNSSLALSVEASRSTLCYLEAAEHVLVDGVFWTLVFYPMSALLAIFCSILSNPLDPRSRDDLDRLRLATQMIQRIFERKLPENEMEQLKMVGEFVSELKRLAECSIDKAWSEQSATLMSR